MRNKLPLTIFLIGVLIRILWLGEIPSGFFRDEAALGYNAYSIWETGRDEFGQSFPLVFRSYEVFFLPLYVYLSAPVVGIFGLTEVTTRFISSLSGILALTLVYFIAKEVFDRKIAVISLILLTISPWHVFYSRGAFEGNLGLTFFAAGFLFFILFLKTKRAGFTYLSSLSFIASIYSYQSERVIVPLFVIVCLLLTFKKLWPSRAKILTPTLASLVLLFPILSFTSKAAGTHRAFGVSIFNSVPHGWIENTDAGFLSNNPFFLRGRQVAALYVSYFSPKNLFVEGDYDKQRSVVNFSVFYTFMFPFMIIGFWKILKRRSLQDKLILAWTFLAPVPASLTGDPFHTYRSLLLYFPLTIISAVGLNLAYRIFVESKLFAGITTIFLLSNFANFIFSYTTITQTERARNWDYGYKEIVAFVKSQGPGRIVVDDPWTESYIHYLFFAKVDPEIYQNAVLKLIKPKDFYYEDSSEIRPERVENWEFRSVDWSKERGNGGTTFIFWADDLPESEFEGDPNVELLREIMYPDGDIAYRIVRIKG